MQERTIEQISSESLSIRLYLEPVVFNLVSDASSNDAFIPGNSLGVPAYIHPTLPKEKKPKWYRVLGVAEHIDCKSKVFIFASLPEIAEPVCSIANAVHVDIPGTAVVPFIEMNWGDSLLQRTQPCNCGSILRTTETIYSKRVRFRSPTLQNPDRKCNGRLVVKASHPNLSEIVDDCRDCVTAGQAASIIGGIAAAYYGPTGIPAAMATSFKTAFWSCLALKGISWALDVKVSIKMTGIECD